MTLFSRSRSCKIPVDMDATLNGRLGFYLESTCGRRWPACPMHVACYNSEVCRFGSLMSDKAPVCLWGAASFGLRQQASGAACRQWLHVAWAGSDSVGRACPIFLPSFGEASAQHCFSHFFCWRGWFSQSDLHNLDFPFLFSALHYSCASWALVNGRAYLIQRSVRVPTSQCWRHLRVVLWRSPTACGIPWKPGGGKLSRRPSRCIQSSLLDMNLVLRGTATAVRAHRLSYSILRIFTHTFIQTISKHNTSSTAQGGGGSFKNRKPVGKVGCCESRMAGRSHWWIERWLMPPLFLSLSLTIYLPTNLSIDLSIYLSIYLYLSVYLSLSFVYLSSCLAVYLSIYLSVCLSICLPVYLWCSVIQCNVV